VSEPLYRRELLRLAADATGTGRLGAPNATGHAFNPTCGDHVSVELTLAGGRIAEFAYETRACVLAQASASILGSALQDATMNDVEKLRANVGAMLELKEPPPSLPFEAYATFEGAAEYQSRHRCVLLPIDAVLDAFAKADTK